MILVDEDKALKAGFSRGHIKTPPEAGGQNYANVEVFHQLHCLNLLRKTSYWNHDYYANLGEVEFVNEDYIVGLHAGESPHHEPALVYMFELKEIKADRNTDPKKSVTVAYLLKQCLASSLTLKMKG